MSEEDGDALRGPRSTAEAHAMLRMEAARRLLANPEAMPQPWNETRPNGWPLSEAVLAFVPQGTRGQVSLYLGMLAEGFPDQTIAANLTAYGWHFLRRRLASGELTATGFPDGETEPRPMHASVFDTAELDPAGKEVIAGSRRFGAVRVFEAAHAPTPMQAQAAAETAVTGSTGFAGRPTARPLMEPEMRARANRGELCSSLAGEVRHLLEWLEHEHPGERRPQQKSAENTLRSLYGSLKNHMK